MALTEDAKLQAAFDAEAKGPGKEFQADPNLAIGSADLDAAFAAEQSEMTVQPQSDFISAANTPFKPFFEYTKANWDMGAEQVASSAVWGRALRGEISDDEAMNQVSDSKMRELKEKQLDPIDNAVDPLYLRKIYSESLKALPYMSSITGGGFAGAAGGGAVGAGLGLAGGPFAELTVPAGFLGGVQWGMKGGTFLSAANLASGEMYGTLRKKGIPRDQAIQAAIAYGAVSGGLFTINLGVLSGAAKQAFAKHMTSKTGKALIENAVSRYLSSIGAQVGISEIQALAAIITENVTAIANGKPTISNKEIADRIAQAFEASLAAAVGLTAGAKATGFVAGKAVTTARDLPSSVKAIFDTARDTGMKSAGTKKQVKASDVKAATTPGQIKKLVGRVETIANLTVDKAEANLEAVENTRKALRDEIVDLEERYDQGENVDFDLRAKKQEMAFIIDLKKDARRRLLQARIEERLRTDELLDPQEAQNLVQAGIETRFTTTRTIEQNQELLNQFANLALPEKLRGKVQADIREATSISKLDDAWQSVKDKLNKLADKVDHESAMKQLKGQLERIETIPEDARKENRFGFVAGEALKEYGRLIHDELASGDKHQGLAEKVLNGFDAGMEKMSPDSYVSTELDLRQVIAGEVIGLKNKSPQEIADLAAHLKEIADNGISERLEKRLAEKAERAETIYMARQNGGGRFKITRNKDGELVKSEVNVSAIEKIIRTHGETYAPWNVLMENVFQTSKDANEIMRRLDVHDEVQTELSNISAQTKVAWSLLEGPERNKKLVGEIWAKSSVPEDFKGQDKYYDQDGYLRTLEGYSRDDAIKLYAMMKNPERRAGLTFGNRFTFETAKLKGEHEVNIGEISTEMMLERLLTKEEKQIAARIVEYYNGEAFDRMNEATIDEYGLPLRKMPRYEGHAIREGSTVEEGSSLDLYHRFTDRRAFKPSSLLATTESKKPYVIRGRGAIQTLMTDIKVNEHWLAWRKKAKTLSAVFNDTEFRNSVAHNNSKDTMPIIDHAYKSMIGTRGMQHVQQNRILAYYRGQAASAYTGGKLINSMAQLAGLFNNLAHIGPHELAAGVIDFWLQPVTAIRTLAGTKFLQNRKDNIIAEVQELQQTQNNSLLKLGKMTTKLTMQGIIFFDRVSILVGGWSVYKKFYNDAIKAGKTPEQAHQEGVYQFERSQNRLQGSATIDQMTHTERGGDWQKMATLFFKQPIQAYQSQLVAIRRFLNKPSAANLAKMSSAILAAHMAEAVFEAIRQTPNFLGDDDEKADEAILKTGTKALVGPTLPLWGDLISNAIIFGAAKATNTNIKTYDIRYMPFDSINATGDMGKVLIKGMLDGDLTLEDAFRVLDDFARGPGILIPGLGGLPMRPFIQAVKKEVTEPDKK